MRSKRLISQNAALSSDHILGTPFPRSSLPPTRPISPAAVTRPSTPDVPIIAPPPSNEITRASSSREDAAEARLTILLSKERRQRLEDGLADIPGDGIMSGCGRKLEMQALDWMIDASFPWFHAYPLIICSRFAPRNPQGRHVTIYSFNSPHLERQSSWQHTCSAVSCSKAGLTRTAKNRKKA